ncbi:sulfite exporter TauE/SafE family protein [Oceanipulchritudo coccoides]|uniref:sulfite exporter TauE/SafE family protein n=1 Tax=Oceanipulchritudo coccoides TaxID=2706888 RepID=UPI001EE797FE|nr:sulfite exporter TauE/SafE family protein [Oceanipulchritudo coccoides]
MIEVSSITGPWPAFIAGMVTSLHCAGMCGPLACYIAPKPGSASSFATVASLYQIGRLISYTLIGGLAGGLGMVALGWVDIYQHSLSRFLPWLLVMFFLLVAFRIDKYFPKPAFLTPLLMRLQQRAQALPRPLSGLLVGILTPLLPCGPLYAVFGLALMTQSPIRGAEFLLLFGLGTLPLLWVVQAAFSRWQGAISPVAISRIQRGLALIVAVILGLRLYFFETGQGGLFCGTAM